MYLILLYDDVIKWKHFPGYWPFVQGIYQLLMNSLHKGQWHGALMFLLICTWTNTWANNGEDSDLRCHCTHYDIIVMDQWNVGTFHFTVCWSWEQMKITASGHWLHFLCVTKPPGECVDIKVLSYHCRSSQYKDNKVSVPSYAIRRCELLGIRSR